MAVWTMQLRLSIHVRNNWKGERYNGIIIEGYERRIDQINAVLNSYGISSIEEAEKITKDAGLNVYDQVKKIQPICFENACWAYTVGAAIAIKKGCKRAADAAAAIGEGLQAFCIPGSVADHRKVGLGHGNLGKMLLEEETECFCFLAGHESFAAAEGAIGIAEKANKVRQKPLSCYLKRSWKRRSTDHFPYQRIYIRRDKV